MARHITQRELRNESGEIMRALDHGEDFVVTRNGIPVGELRPVHARRRVGRDAFLAVFANSPAVDFEQFRSDLDKVADPSWNPRV